jgi:hypothetical protein
MSDLHDSELYSAATNALAAKGSTENTYSKMIASAIAYVNVDDFKKQLQEVEKTIREEYDLQVMPDPWRSAKSVVLGAMRLGIHLLDDNFIAKGKSALQAEIKAMKGVDDLKPAVDRAFDLVHKLGIMFHELTTEEANSIKDVVVGFTPGC